MREIEKSNDELNCKLVKKERECEVKSQEKVKILFFPFFFFFFLKRSFYFNFLL